MKRFILGLLLVVLASGAENIFAQQTIKLNSVYKNQEPYRSLSLNKTSEERTYFKLNRELVTDSAPAKGDLMNLELPGGNLVSLKIRRISSYLPGTLSIQAVDPDNRGNALSFTISENAVIGLFHHDGQKPFQFRYDKQQDENYMRLFESHDQMSCELHETDLSLPPKFNNENLNFRTKTASSKTHTPNVAAMAEAVDDSITIDLMLVYTNAAETWAQQDFNVLNLAQVIAEAMNLSQTALDNSGVNIHLRLVHTYKTDYDEENDNVQSGDRLRRLTSGPNSTYDWGDNSGYMEEVHTLRDEYGADVVSMLARISDTGGLGWRIGSTNGNQELAFNLNRVQQVHTGYTLIHEIGHNMGNAHSRTQSSNPAGNFGGLFHYSAGFRSVPNNFATVMAYAEGLEDIPLFSSPQLSWEGNKAGSSSSKQPANNVRSMKEIKRAFASYRPTMIDSPFVVLSANQIDVEMNREDELEVLVDIDNAGNSPLVWDVDFNFTGASVNPTPSVRSKQSKSETGLKRLVPENLPAKTFNIPPRKEVYSSNSSVVYNTSFEATEGFAKGEYDAVSSWRSFADSIAISDLNPATGSKHMRVEYQPDVSGSHWIKGPFFGDQPFGNYEVSLNFALSNSGATNSERFDIYLFDNDTQSLSSGVVISNGGMSVWGENENLDGSFFSTNANIVAGQYYNLRIEYNTSDELVQYYLNNQLISEENYVGDNLTPDLMYIIHGNNQVSTFIDIDDISITSKNTPYDWLQSQNFGGVVLEQQTGQLSLKFSTVGVAAGTYETDMSVFTNDPQNPVSVIPITLTVNTSVSNEGETDTPKDIELSQNYPNPFNPTTVIKYSLAQTQKVSLQVFSIQGKKVAELINGTKEAGKHEVTFDASSLSSGVYLYRLKTAEKVLTRKMILIK